MKKLLLASAVLLPIAASAATTPPPFQNTPVIVTNPPNQAANVFVVNPASTGTPVTLSFTWDATLGFSNGTPYTVPDGKQLIIETTSGGCVELEAVASQLGIADVTVPSNKIYGQNLVYLAVVLPTPFSQGNQSYVFNSSSKALVGPGRIINLRSDGQILQAGGLLQCAATVFGELINVQ